MAVKVSEHCVLKENTILCIKMLKSHLCTSDNTQSKQSQNGSCDTSRQRQRHANIGLADADVVRQRDGLCLRILYSRGSGVAVLGLEKIGQWVVFACAAGLFSAQLLTTTPMILK